MSSGCVGALNQSKFFISPEMVKQAEEERLKRIEEYKLALSECEKTPWQRKTAYSKQQCINQAEQQNPEPKFIPDLRRALEIDNLGAALSFSEGKISKDRFLHQLTENQIKAEFAAKQLNEQRLQQMRQEALQQQQVDELQRMRKAQAWQAFGQSMQNYSNQMQQQQYQQQMLMNMNRPINTNCYRFGNNLNCTSY